MAERVILGTMVPNPTTKIVGDMSDGDIALLKEIFQDQFDTASVDLLSSRLDAAHSFRAVLETTEKILSQDVAARLGFLKALCDIAGGDLALVRIAANHKNLTTIRDVALNYYALGIDKPSSATAGIDPGHLVDFRANLFAADCTAFLRALVDTAILPLPADIKPHVQHLLQTALDDGFDIAHQSVRLFLGDREHMQTIPADKQQAVSDFIAALQRLQAIVHDPENIGTLMRASFFSAKSIASTPAPSFVSTIESTGLASGSASRIWNHASVITVRNEDIWTSYLRARNEIPVAATGGHTLLTKAQPQPKSPAAEAGIINLSTLFTDVLQSTECADCSSVTSAAAYFVEQLQILKTWPTDPMDLKSDSLRTKLFQRRPDLQDLQLSCANTNVLIPYIDLVNEALEAVAKSASAVITETFNMAETDTSDECIAEPQHVSFEVYEKVIQPLVSPLKLFPYNQAIDSIRQYLVAVGTTRYKLLVALRSEQRLVKSVAGSTKALAAAVLDRAAAAEAVGLLQEEYIAVTHEAFQTMEFLQASNVTDYRSKIGLKAVSAYWGYDTDAAMVAAEATGLTGLKDQFLARADMTFQELLDLLKTSYVAKRVVIENDGGTETFTGKLEEMRLRQLLDDAGTTGPLTVAVCDELQAFIRLWRKLGWGIVETDAAVVMLAGGRTTGVDTVVVDGLAYIKQMVVLTKVPISNLLPLWGAIDTRRETSLYARLFLQRRLTNEDDVFAPDDKGEYLKKPGTKISEHKQVILSTLRLTAPGLDAIIAAAKITDDLLTLSSISLIYRVSLLCQIFDISPLNYGGFLSLYPDGFNPFDTPRQTLDVVRQFAALKKAKWSLEQLLFVVKGVLDPEQSYVPQGDVVAATVAMVASNAAIKATPTEDVASAAYALFGAGVSKDVVQFIEGTSFVTKNVVLKSKVEIPDALRAKVQLRQASDGKSGVLRLTGILTAAERTALVGAVLGDDTWAASIESLDTSSKSLFENLLAPLLTKSNIPHSTVLERPTPPSSATPDERAAFHEQATTPIRNAYLSAMRSTLQSKLAQQAVLQILKPSFPVMDSEVMQLLLSDVLTVGSGVSGMEALCDLVPPAIGGASFTGHFLPPSTDVYVFTSTLADKPVFSIDGVAVEFMKEGSVWKSSMGKRLVNGQSYNIAFTGHLDKDILWSTTLGAPSAFTPAMLIDGGSVAGATDVFTKLSKVAELLRISSLQLEEVHYFQENSAGFDFNNITFANVQLLRMYAEMRDAFPQPKTAAFPLLTHFKWLARPDDPSQLAPHIALATGWPEHLVVEILAAKYPGINPADLVAALRDIAALYSLWDAMRTIQNLTVPSATPEMLYTLATPVAPPVAATDFKNAVKLRLAMHSHEVTQLESSVLAANNSLREHQRAALVAYLLQQPFIRALKLYDADALFEHFLIDVSMGPVVHTSRLKQAISVVQLFVQRCILGLEKGNGIPATSVNRDKWDYMLRYRLWEANRKAFLYAESWIDPTLRDDKSEQFKDLEAVVLQSKLTAESISEVVKSYMYAANEVADLEVQTYLWERRYAAGDFGTFHFFARTRAAPYRYFYRTMDLKGKKASQAVYWKPWTKMDVDIQAQDVDADGNKLEKSGTYLVPALYRGRLFLFIPQIVLKSHKKEGAEPDSFVAMGNGSPSAPEMQKHWEVGMGWTEWRNGKWSPKQVSQATIKVGGLAAAVAAGVPGADSKGNPTGLRAVAVKLPDVSAFKFWVRERTFKLEINPDPIHILVVDVERCITAGDTSVAYPLGQFELRGQQLVAAAADPGTPWNPTVPTSFMKLTKSWPAAEPVPVPKTVIKHGAHNKRPYLTVTPPPDLAATYTWTMSFDELNSTFASGMLVDVGTAHSVQTLFGFPPYIREGYDPEYDEEMETAVFPDVVSPILLETASLSDGLLSVYHTLSALPTALHFDGFGGRNSKVFHEQANPAAIYTWEAGVHTVSLLVERLFATQQYEAALSMARCVFDPTIDGTSVDRCWLFPPFRDPTVQAGNPLDFSSTWENKLAAAEWNANRASVHAAARGRPIAYMKRFAMKYIEILVAAGDEYFRQNTLESIPLAVQRYVEASHIFGPAGLATPSLGRRTAMTYRQLEGKLDGFSNATLDLELDFPFHSHPTTRGDTAARSVSPMAFIQTGYFCIPTNPQFADLKNLIDNRLFNIRNSMDINGKVQTLPLFEPPIDPGMLARASAAGLSPSAIASDLDSPMPNYRFQYLLGRAFELCSELKSMDALALNVKEKKDAEALSALTAGHQSAVQTLVMEMKTTQKQEALKAIDTLTETRKMHETRLRFYLALTGDKSKQVPNVDSDWEDIEQSIETPSTDDLRANSNEKLDMDKSEAAIDLNNAAASVDKIASALLVFPGVTVNVQPLGVGVSTEIGAGIVARAMQVGSSVLKQQAQMALDKGLMATKKAALIRQLQERRMQANQAGREIKVTDRMIAAQKARVAVCDSEIKAQQKEMDNAAEMEEWLRSKYTNKELYAWMENQYNKLFHQTYLLANELATKAEKAFRFERATDSTTFLRQGGGGYWDGGRGGMLCAENMYIDLKKMEAAYLGKRAHDFEVVKSVSLRRIDPWALLTLRETGSTKFSLPEVLFDIDFPGHFCRRIRTVSLTIPCVVGPYTSLNCTLNLQSHKYRITSKTTGSYPEDLDGDGRFRTDNIPITSIAVSTGQQDSGVFELDFHGERYLPFEGAGAISTWQIDLPTVLRQFDYNTISDVVMHMKYTASDGGATLKSAANAATLDLLKTAKAGTTTAIIDVTSDFASEWYAFVAQLASKQTGTLKLKGVTDMLPFWTRHGTTKATKISVLVSPPPQDAQFKDSLKIAEYNSVEWVPSSNLPGYVILASKDEVGKEVAKEWNFTVTNDKALTVERMWLVVEYTFEQ